MVASAAIAAKGAAPDGVELLDEGTDERGVVGQDAVLKVALALGLCTHPRAGEIGAAKVRLHAVDDDTLEMDTRTQHPLHRRPKRRIAVEVVPPVRSWVLRMDEPHLDPALHQPVQHLQERHHIPPASIHIHILDVVTAERSEGRAQRGDSRGRSPSAERLQSIVALSPAAQSHR